ncbi:MAG: UDP-N-acetylmuramoyl-tripeptide--D-alanyl-D-alanine ligase [Armatimonadota bacterium]|nr:UDP-N-acetylmuramoyl-tripeptide--D-alanyl-D-alanine ligase [Armatimonadota bacterium]
MRLTVREIVEATGGKLLQGDPEVVITGVSTDSRTIRRGELFVPLRGPRTDGHHFIGDALRRGAIATLTAKEGVEGVPNGSAVIAVEDPLRALGAIARAYRERVSLTVVGATGSVGKTTTVKMAREVLGTRFRVASTREEWNAEIGIPLAILGLDEKTEVAVLEMAMRGLGQIRELVEIARPKIGVVTNIGESHLGLLGSRENIARAKGELLEGLPPEGIAILNADDDFTPFLQTLHRGEVVTFGFGPEAMVRASEVVRAGEKTRFLLQTGKGSVPVEIRALGVHNVSNALAAAAVGLSLGLTLEEIREGLERFTPAKMRLLPVALPQGVLLLDDTYNASPTSTRAALAVLKDLGKGRRKVAVLGEMLELGESAEEAHRQIGQEVARHGVEVLIAVGELGRFIAAGAQAVGLERVRTVLTCEEALSALLEELRPLDVVLVKASRAVGLERVVEGLRKRLWEVQGENFLKQAPS